MREILIPLAEAARLERRSYSAQQKHCRRQRTPLRPDPEDRRRLLVPVEALSALAFAQWQKEQVQSALALAQRPTEGSATPFLPFEPALTSGERAAPPAVPERYAPQVERELSLLGETLNHRWRKFLGQTYGGVLIQSRHDFIVGSSNLLGPGFSISQIYELLKIAKQKLNDDAIPKDQKWSAIAQALLPKPRSGRPPFFTRQENAWQWPVLRGFYLNQANLSMRRAWEMLLEEIRSREVAAQGKALYERPTFRQASIALSKLDLPTVTLARQGEAAYNDRCAPCLSRRPPAHANDVWVTDQRLCNVRLRDGCNRLGRVWVVNFLDVSSWRWLGCMFGPVLNSDVVMYAAAMALERAGVPRAIHMDLGKEFVGKRFLGGTFTVRGEVLFRDCLGLWESLDVQVVRAIGKNPQSKIIERWHHELDRFDQEMPGWCGPNPGEKPEKLAREEAAHQTWLEKGVGRSPLLGIPEYAARYVDFCERRWNAQHRGRGRYRQGMTPSEAWNTRLPEGGLRTLTRAEVDFFTSDHRMVKVARGGQVNLTFQGQMIEYEAPELFHHQDEAVEVIISRRSLRQVTVIYSVRGGKASCVATAKPLHDWLPENRDELRQALRCRAALKRAVKRGFSASEALAAAPSLAELPAVAAEIAPEVAASFAAPGPRPEQEMSGSEWKMRRRRLAPKTLTSEKIAQKMRKTEEGP